jgi:DNA invertase Pin-like site-specific DNA recombinase
LKRTGGTEWHDAGVRISATRIKVLVKSASLTRQRLAKLANKGGIPMATTKRAALYLRVSTGDQNTENQRRVLAEVAELRGWAIVATYADPGISGAKGRDKRPQLDAMLKDAVRGKFDVVMTWAIDRLGRSLIDLLATMQDLRGAEVDLFVHQQAVDTTTPSGNLLFQVMGAFAEFERAIIQSRVQAGLDRAKAEQAAGIVRRDRDGKLKKPIGRPAIDPKVEAAIRARLATGAGMLKVAAEFGVGSGTVQRIKREMSREMSQAAD